MGLHLISITPITKNNTVNTGVPMISLPTSLPVSTTLLAYPTLLPTGTTCIIHDTAEHIDDQATFSIMSMSGLSIILSTHPSQLPVRTLLSLSNSQVLEQPVEISISPNPARITPMSISLLMSMGGMRVLFGLSDIMSLHLALIGMGSPVILSEKFGISPLAG